MSYTETVSYYSQNNIKIILIVEDDQDIGPLLVEVLSQETPYKAFWVTDGLQALNIVDMLHPNLFITDYWLPYLNGIELYDKICQEKGLPNIPTIIISAYMPEQEVRKRHLVGIHKPFELNDLLNTVEMLLEKEFE